MPEQGDGRWVAGEAVVVWKRFDHKHFQRHASGANVISTKESDLSGRRSHICIRGPQEETGPIRSTALQLEVYITEAQEE